MSVPLSRPLVYKTVSPSGENVGELITEPEGTRPSSGFACSSAFAVQLAQHNAQSVISHDGVRDAIRLRMPGRIERRLALAGERHGIGAIAVDLPDPSA